MDNSKILGAFYLRSDSRLIWEPVLDGEEATIKKQLTREEVVKYWTFPRKMPENPVEFIGKFLEDARSSGALEADVLRIAERNKIGLPVKAEKPKE